MAVFKEHLYLQDEATLQLLQYNQGSWKEAPVQPHLSIMAMYAYHGSSDTILLATWKDGLYLQKGTWLQSLSIDPVIRQHQLYSISLINNQTYALGTASNGIYFVDHLGHTIRHLSTEEGLQNNHIRTLFADHESNLWMGMDEGIDMIHYNSAIHKIKPALRQANSAYTIKLLNNALYIGTAEGLYRAPVPGPAPGNDISLSHSSFSLVPQSEGQIWDVDTVNGMLVMTHHDGLFTLQGNRAHLITDEHKGVWQLKRLPQRNRLLAGTYEGLQLLQQASGQLRSVPLYNNTLKESLRFLEIDDSAHIVWASHPHRGIYQISMSRGFDTVVSIRLFTQANGLPGQLENYVFKINHHILFATTKGIYEFDRVKQSFYPSPRYAALFGSIPIRYMVADAAGKIWFTTGDQTGVADKSTITYFPELKGQLVSGFEKIYPYNDNNILIASYKGVIHLNYGSYEKKRTILAAKLTRVITHDKKDSLLHSDYFVDGNRLVNTQPLSAIHNMAPGYNSFHFEFASNQLREAGKVLYSCRLAGLAEEWSAWSTQTFRDYVHLPYGSYRFEVRVQDNLGNISIPTLYAFSIQPRWYQTKLAKFFYLLVLVVLGWLLSKLHHRRLHLQKQKFEKEEAQLKYLHELELQNNEKEIIQLKNERLETEVLYKNKELASTTMHLYKRGRLLGKIREELTEATKKLPTKEERGDFVKVLKLIAEEEKRENDWKQFAIHFDQVHNRFLSKIKAAYPDLSSTDLKICAYLKMNLSSKEIAQLLSISLKGVEVARYRLRKKLDLSASVNLSDFINQVALEESILSKPATAKLPVC